MSKIHFAGLFIYMDNVYFHCHCQFNLIYFWVLLIYIMSYQVLLRPKYVKDVSCWPIHLYGHIFFHFLVLSPTNLYHVLLSPTISSQVCQNISCWCIPIYGQFLCPLSLSMQLDLFFASY